MHRQINKKVNMFDRYEILTKHYSEEIKQWNWLGLVKEALSNCFYDSDNRQIVASVYLGSVLSIYPSHKYYMPWCSNQTRSDETKDSCFQEALEEIANSYGLFVTGSDSDGCDILLQKIVDKSEVLGYITTEDQDLINENC